jgi:hypothetical protein
VPETDYLEPAFKSELIAYVQAGGSLLLVGPATAALFAPELGATLEGVPQTETRYLAHAGTLIPTKDRTQSVTIGKATPFGQLHATNDPNSPTQPAASINTLGRGKIAATYFSFSRAYVGDRSAAVRGFLKELTRQLFPRPVVEVSGSPDVDVAVNRLNGRLTINLVNTAGPHADVQSPIQDAIPSVGPLALRIRTPQKPSRITLEPGNDPLAFEYRDGVAQLSLPRLDIHSIVVVE